MKNTIEDSRFFSVFSDVAISDISVAIYVSGPHRRDVLDAVSVLIEQLKTNVPIWKKVTFSSSSFFHLFASFRIVYIHMNNSIIFSRSSTKIMRATTTTITTTTKHQRRIVGKKINKFVFFCCLFYLTLIHIQTSR